MSTISSASTLCFTSCIRMYNHYHFINIYKYKTGSYYNFQKSNKNFLLWFLWIIIIYIYIYIYNNNNFAQCQFCELLLWLRTFCSLLSLRIESTHHIISHRMLNGRAKNEKYFCVGSGDRFVMLRLLFSLLLSHNPIYIYVAMITVR